MKKHISIILILALVLSIFTGYLNTAKAATGIEMDISPSEVSGSGSVSLTASITNTSEETLEAGYTIRRSQSETCVTVDTALPGGSSDDVTFSYTVKDSEVGGNISFSIYDAGGSLVDGSQSTVKVKTLSVGIGATFSVSPSPLAASGDTVSLDFVVENQGQASLTNIAVKLNGKMLHDQVFTLAASEKKSFSYPYTVTAAGPLAPVITYEANGTSGTYNVAPVEIQLETRDVDMTLTPSTTTPQPNEDVTFKVEVVNNGNVSYKDVKLTMNGVEVDIPVNKLNPGGSFTAEYTQSFTASTDVTFELILTDHKQEIVSVSKSVSIELPVDDSEIVSKLTMDVEVDRTSLTSAGTVNFSGNILNGTDYTLTNLLVTEKTSGAEVYNYSLLASYASTSFEYAAEINETTTYNFELTVTDTAGGTHTIAAQPITVTITSAQASDYSDAADVSPGEQDASNKSGLGAVMIIAIILVVLIIGVGVALLVLWRAQKSGKAVGKQPGAVKKRPAIGAVKRKGPVSRGYRDRNNF